MLIRSIKFSGPVIPPFRLPIIRGDNLEEKIAIISIVIHIALISLSALIHSFHPLSSCLSGVFSVCDPQVCVCIVCTWCLFHFITKRQKMERTASIRSVTTSHSNDQHCAVAAIPVQPLYNDSFCFSDEKTMMTFLKKMATFAWLSSSLITEFLLSDDEHDDEEESNEEDEKDLICSPPSMSFELEGNEEQLIQKLSEFVGTEQDNIERLFLEGTWFDPEVRLISFRNLENNPEWKRLTQCIRYASSSKIKIFMWNLQLYFPIEADREVEYRMTHAQWVLPAHPARTWKRALVQYNVDFPYAKNPEERHFIKTLIKANFIFDALLQPDDYYGKDTFSLLHDLHIIRNAADQNAHLLENNPALRVCLKSCKTAFERYLKSKYPLRNVPLVDDFFSSTPPDSCYTEEPPKKKAKTIDVDACCAVCYEPFSSLNPADVKVTECGHAFCWKCLQKWARDKAIANTVSHDRESMMAFFEEAEISPTKKRLLVSKYVYVSCPICRQNVFSKQEY